MLSRDCGGCGLFRQCNARFRRARKVTRLCAQMEQFTSWMKAPLTQTLLNPQTPKHYDSSYTSKHDAFLFA